MTRAASHFSPILLAVAITAWNPARAAQPGTIAWDWAARAPAFDPAATPSETPILLYFSAQWCGFCKQMDRTTLADQTVRLQLGAVTHVKLDLDDQQDLAKRYAINGIPAFVLVNERGEEISRFVGATDSLTFVKWFEAGEKRASEIALAAQKRTAELRRLAGEAQSKDPAVQASVRTAAFGFLGRAEPAAQDFATGYLSHLVETDPQALLGGLMNPDLAVRIAVSNILRAKFGDEFQFDPWSSADERRTAIEHLVLTMDKPGRGN